MLTAHDLNDAAGSRRIGHFLPLFRAAPAPDPVAGDWRAWQALLGSRSFAPGAGPHDAMTIQSENGFATLSSALIALPGPGSSPSRSCSSLPGPRTQPPMRRYPCDNRAQIHPKLPLLTD
jgi:hypothetical protein